MRAINSLGAMAILLFTIAGCTTSGKEKKGELNDKKVELQKLKSEQTKLSEKIQKLEEEILFLDPGAAAAKTKLVNTTILSTQNFSHYIDLQGKVTTENIYYVTPRGPGGQVRAIYVKEGDRVRQGQLILRLDDAIIQQNLKQLETQLAFAKNLYQRHKNLWDQGIGSEVQVLTAKNNVENLEKQINIVKEQQNTANVYAQAAGIIESVNIRVGETFTGSPAAGITIVNPNNLKVGVEVPENYLSRVKKGSPVIIEVPDVNKKFNSTISLVSELINPNSRAFTAEAKIPSDRDLKPNQLALVKIRDYSASDVIVIPMNTIQTDEKGKYVFVVAEEKGKKIAAKRPVVVGELYGEYIEVKQGLTPGDQLISQGYQGLYEGQFISTQAN